MSPDRCGGHVEIVSYMQSCPTRNRVLGKTLADLATTDWGAIPMIELDDAATGSPLLRQRMLVRRILERAVRDGADFVLLLEDDLEFNHNLSWNLSCWFPLRVTNRSDYFFASLFNPGVRFRNVVVEMAYAQAEPPTVHGSQALLMSHGMARYLVNCWGVEPAAHLDLRLQRLAARVCPILYHVPSLIQHRRTPSTWGGPFKEAADFDRTWRAV
jgi:hypothetical protein